MEACQEHASLNRPSFESPLVVIAAMVVVVAALFGATKLGLNQHFAAREAVWQQEIVDEKARIEAVQAHRQEQAETARAAGVSGGMKLISDKVLEQMETGLQWTAQDNGRDLSWQEAIDYCQSSKLEGGGWQLPTSSQLMSLYDRKMTNPIACGDTVCKVSALFVLSRQFAWTNESAGEYLAWYVSLEYGTQYAESIRVPSYYRALCVRGT